MTKTINLSSLSFIAAGSVLALFLVLTATTQVAQAATINSQLELGSRGSQVTDLQEFLSTESSIYPAGLVTGYFGPMTQAAVVQFQAAYDLPQVGRVGPMTLDVVNEVMSSGSGNIDISAPTMSNNSAQVSNTGATINWSTNEPARGQVFYSTSPIQAQEATRHAQQPYISGASTLSNSLSGSQTVNLQGLQPNTTYYYLNVGTDSSGNVSMHFPNTFHTNI